MKLYTEEQLMLIIQELKKAFLPENIECDGAHCMGCWKDVVRDTINLANKLTPIELPSDEEVENTELGSGMHNFYKGGFIEGAHWMKEQIKRQSDEN